MTSPHAHDLTPTLSNFMDLHMALSLMTRAETHYNPMEVKKAMLVLLEKTKMVDLIGDIHKQVNGGSELPKHLKDKR